MRARKLRPEDHDYHDVILAADQSNIAFMNTECETINIYKINMLIQYSPTISVAEIPETYGAGMQRFEYVLVMISQACEGLLHNLKKN